MGALFFVILAVWAGIRGETIPQIFGFILSGIIGAGSILCFVLSSAYKRGVENEFVASFSRGYASWRDMPWWLQLPLVVAWAFAVISTIGAIAAIIASGIHIYTFLSGTH